MVEVEGWVEVVEVGVEVGAGWVAAAAAAGAGRCARGDPHARGGPRHWITARRRGRNQTAIYTHLELN